MAQKSRFSQADASSLFFAVLRSHQAAVKNNRGGGNGPSQQVSSGRLPLREVHLVLRRAARRVFPSLAEDRGYEKLLAEHICAPDVDNADTGAICKTRRLCHRPLARFLMFVFRACLGKACLDKASPLCWRKLTTMRVVLQR
jgi:hypothetical protein